MWINTFEPMKGVIDRSKNSFQHLEWTIGEVPAHKGPAARSWPEDPEHREVGAEGHHHRWTGMDGPRHPPLPKPYSKVTRETAL